ncbi:transcription factor bHLH94-like [Phragmites australis]|uniref:transcription factor bHLH94-like n=1 Tax=Phragmites australis TaxID=29695 RepID=UPI002D765DF7|nr:transcription factor bHLH94-like [Phragmites australis]
MALLEAVVFPQDHRRLPCCRSCGISCVLCGYGVDVVAGEFEGIKRGVVVQDDEEHVATPPHGSACCACPADVAGAATSWVGPAPSTLTSSARRPVQQASNRRRRRRRRRTTAKAARDVEEAEIQRLSHIVVERNRRRQMNEYLAALRALMPPSYARRGDQASIVGAAINFVKELEHRLQSLQAHKRHAAAAGHRPDPDPDPEPFAGFFTFPQYSTAAMADVDDARSTRRGVADIEAAVSDGHATVKVLAQRRPGQHLLLKLLLGLQQCHGLAALHLSVTTTADRMVFYTIILRMGDGCQLSSAGDIAAAVHDIVADVMNTAEGVLLRT